MPLIGAVQFQHPVEEARRNVTDGRTGRQGEISGRVLTGSVRADEDQTGSGAGFQGIPHGAHALDNKRSRGGAVFALTERADEGDGWIGGRSNDLRVE